MFYILFCTFCCFNHSMSLFCCLIILDALKSSMCLLMFLFLCYSYLPMLSSFRSTLSLSSFVRQNLVPFCYFDTASNCSFSCSFFFSISSLNSLMRKYSATMKLSSCREPFCINYFFRSSEDILLMSLSIFSSFVRFGDSG